MTANCRFICSILFIPIVLVANNIIVSSAVCALFFILVLCKKKHVKLLPPLIFVFSIVFFSILQPSGKILFSIANFHITQGSIVLGLEKALKLLAMVYISQYAISRELKINGSIGNFLHTVFLYFDELTTYKKSFSIKNPIKSLDEILLKVYHSK